MLVLSPDPRLPVSPAPLPPSARLEVHTCVELLMVLLQLSRARAPRPALPLRFAAHPRRTLRASAHTGARRHTHAQTQRLQTLRGDRRAEKGAGQTKEQMSAGRNEVVRSSRRAGGSDESGGLVCFPIHRERRSEPIPITAGAQELTIQAGQDARGLTAGERSGSRASHVDEARQCVAVSAGRDRMRGRLMVARQGRNR